MTHNSIYSPIVKKIDGMKPSKINTVGFINTICFYTFIVFCIIFSGMRVLGPDADYYTYMDIVVFKSEEMLGANELAFTALVWINDVFFNSNFQTFLLMFAAIGVSTKLSALLRYSKIPVLSFSLYIFSYFVLHEYVQIRAGVATGIFLFSIIDLTNQNTKKYFYKALLAIAFHWSSVILLPLYLAIRYTKNWIFYCLPFVGIAVHISGVNSDTLINYALEPFDILKMYYKLHSGHQEKINAFNLISISQILMFSVFSIIYFRKEKIDAFDHTLYKIFSLALFLFFSLSTFGLPVIAFRLSEYLNVVLLLLIPAIASLFKEKLLISILFATYFAAYLYHLIVNVQVIPGLF